MLENLERKIPMSRMGQVGEIAGMASVLVSNVAGYSTATTIFVDGGLLDYPDFAHGGEISGRETRSIFAGGDLP